VINSSQSATVLADYANVANVNVSVGCGTVYSSSDNNVATVTTNGLVTAVHGGSATVTATLGSSTSSVVVKVTTSLQYSVSTSGGSSTLTFSWPTSVGASFVLQTSPVLGPGAVWTAVSGTPTVVGSNYQLDVPVNPATPAAFYRLGQ
jgi:hypothetical protein